MIEQNKVAEFCGQILDIFENFLELKGVNIEKGEKDKNDCSAIIYGSDYWGLQESLENTLRAWKIID